MKKILEETYDAVVVGAGHAGCEAALALARLGFSTALFTVSVDSIALMPCNPNVGGSSKGHLVREEMCIRDSSRSSGEKNTTLQMPSRSAVFLMGTPSTAIPLALFLFR